MFNNNIEVISNVTFDKYGDKLIFQKLTSTSKKEYYIIVSSSPLCIFVHHYTTRILLFWFWIMNKVTTSYIWR